MKRIKEFLEEKEINYHLREKEIIIPYMVNDLKFHITIQFHKKWLVVSALIVKNKQIPEDCKLKVMKEILIANHELPEICYEMSRDGDIYASVDMRLSIIDFDNFFSEFYSIPFGIKKFIDDIAPSCNIEVTGFP